MAYKIRHHSQLTNLGFTVCYWIDVSPDGNLVIGAGEATDIQVFDKRENKIVKKFEDVNPGKRCLS